MQTVKIFIKSGIIVDVAIPSNVLLEIYDGDTQYTGEAANPVTIRGKVWDLTTYHMEDNIYG